MTRTQAAIVFGVGLLLASALVAYGQADFYARKPKAAVIYRDGAVEPWADVDIAIAVLRDMAPETIRHGWIEVIGPNAPINGREINGTVRRERPPLGPTHYVIVVRQLPGGACASDSVFHEAAEHVLSLIRHGDGNGFHSRPDLKAFGLKMLAECERRKQKR